MDHGGSSQSDQAEEESEDADDDPLEPMGLAGVPPPPRPPAPVDQAPVDHTDAEMSAEGISGVHARPSKSRQSLRTGAWNQKLLGPYVACTRIHPTPLYNVRRRCPVQGSVMRNASCASSAGL